MEFVTRKSDCKRPAEMGLLIKSPKEITKRQHSDEPTYCIIVKPFHSSFLPYRQIIFRGVTFSHDFSIELIRNNDAEAAELNQEGIEHIFNAPGNTSIKVA